MKPRSADARRIEAEYFEGLRKELAGKDNSEVSEITQSIKEHIEEALAECVGGEVSHLQMANVLERLGPPGAYIQDDDAGRADAPVKVEAKTGNEKAAKYSKRDLKAVDIFALVLVGCGILFFALGVISIMTSPKIAHKPVGKAVSGKAKYSRAPDSETGAKSDVKHAGKTAARKSNAGGVYVLLGIVFACLGIALNLGLRRVMRNKGYDISDEQLLE